MNKNMHFNVPKKPSDIRKKFNYSPELFEEYFKKLLELTEFSDGTYVLGEIINELDDEKLKNLFIYDLGKFFDNFFCYFKDIDSVPKKYLKVVFNGFNDGGRVHFDSPGFNSKYYNNYLKFLSITISAVINNKRRDYLIDGKNEGKHTREKNLQRKR